LGRPPDALEEDGCVLGGIIKGDLNKENVSSIPFGGQFRTLVPGLGQEPGKWRASGLSTVSIVHAEHS